MRHWGRCAGKCGEPARERGFEQGATDIQEVVPNDTRGIPTGWFRVPGRDYVDILHDNYSQDSAGPGYYVLLNPQSGSYFLDMNGGGSTGGIYQDIEGLRPAALTHSRSIPGAGRRTPMACCNTL
jgi:hypothetical protein